MPTLAPLATPPTQSLATPSSSPNVGDQFGSFIKLLTAQVKNQDPLSPLDSTQFVEQLATFSSLEQQVQSNTNLNSIASMIGGLHALIANQWLGQTVTVESSWVPFTGKSVDFQFDTPDGIDRAELVVLDSKGTPVWKQGLDLTAAAQSWSGQQLDGKTALPDQPFQFRIDLYRGTDYAGSKAPRVITEVTNVDSASGSLRLGTAASLMARVEDVRKFTP